MFNGLNNAANGNQVTFTSGFGNGGINGNGNTGITAIELVNTVPNSSLVMANAVTLSTDSTIDVTGFSSDTISGVLSMGTNTLFVTGGSTGRQRRVHLVAGDGRRSDPERQSDVRCRQ